VAAVHSGWRGTAAGIVPGAIERLGRVHGVPPSRLAVVIGPAVGACHYEVGEEVVEALAGRGIPEPMWLDRGYAGGPRVDLRALLRAELEAAGVPRDRIELAGGCTFCDPALASYRRDGADAGRQWSMIWRRGSRGAA
jgi:copper oxidase (laccase) domain-containing protein